MPRTTWASAPGKAVLLGEYAVLEGAPALVAAIDRRARVSMTAAAGWALTALGVHAAPFTCTPQGEVQFADPAVQAMPRFNTVRAVLCTLARAQAEHKQTLQPCHITIDTAAFIAVNGAKLGLGASAAVVVALVQALLVHNDAQWLPRAGAAARRTVLMDLASRVHARAQGGMGSGVDIAASVHGGVLRFERREDGVDIAPCAPVPQLGTAFTWAGHAQSTPEFLARVRDFKTRDRRRHHALMQHLGSVARAGVDAWERGHVPDFLAAVATSFAGLGELGRCSGADIASAPHLAMDRVVAQAGGVYKSSGAGGGDLGVAFAAGAGRAAAVAQALTAADFSVLSLAIDPQGVHIDGCTTSPEVHA